MKTKILFITTLLLIVGCSKEPINIETTLVERDGIYYTKDTNKPYTGDVFELYKDGGRKYTGLLKGGKKDGLWTEWKNNGDKESEILYKDGESINEWTSNYYYYDNGQKWYVVTLKDGKQDGLETEWYENGQKKSEITYKDGKKDGLWTSWYENGQKKYEGKYLEGKELDSFNTWNEDGRTMVKNGNGVNIWWYENGQKKSEGTYKNGERDGLWTRWYENGQKKSEGTFKDGKEISYKEWNEDGSVKE